MATRTRKTTPSHKVIYGVVQREGQDKGYWTRIGTAFENADGSFNLLFDYLPTSADTTIQVRNPKEQD